MVPRDWIWQGYSWA